MIPGMVSEVPVVGGLAYIEHLRQMPQTFTVTIVPEPANRYNPKALAVHAGTGVKIGYVAPDTARHYYDGVVAQAATAEPVSCPARLSREQGRLDACAVLDFSRLAALRHAD